MDRAARPPMTLRSAGRARCLALGLAWGLLAVGPAQADAPLVSETADVPDAGDCMLETASDRVRARGQPGITVHELHGSCGIGLRTELGWRLTRERAGRATHRLGVDGKTQLAETGDGGTRFALAYGVAADRAAGDRWRHGGLRVTGVATRALARQLLGHVNLGWLRTENPRLNHAAWSLGVEGEGALHWAADLYGDDRARPWASGGLVWALHEQLGASLAYAQQFDTPRLRQWTVALRFAFR